jgi:hypothetical protein
VVNDKSLSLLKGRRWQKIQFEPVFTKYIRVSFRGNYGNEGSLSVQQVRFVRCKERSVKITSQSPDVFTLESGPSLKGQHRSNSSQGLGDGEIKSTEPMKIILECHADGWPLPTYQWYKGSTLLEGKTDQTLELTVYQEVEYVVDVTRNSSLQTANEVRVTVRVRVRVRVMR